MTELFNTCAIRFKNRAEFERATQMNNLADDVGHADMILTYSNKFHRDRFAGYLISSLGMDIEPVNVKRLIPK